LNPKPLESEAARNDPAHGRNVASAARHNQVPNGSGRTYAGNPKSGVGAQQWAAIREVNT
jgi:hypothetical protein